MLRPNWVSEPKIYCKKGTDLKFSLNERIAEKMEYIWWCMLEYILNPVFPLPPENMHSQLGKAKANFSHTQNDSCDYTGVCSHT